MFHAQIKFGVIKVVFGPLSFGFYANLNIFLEQIYAWKTCLSLPTQPIDSVMGNSFDVFDALS